MLKFVRIYEGTDVYAMKDLHEMSSRARAAFTDLTDASLEKRNQVLLRMADLLILNAQEIFTSNEEDLRVAKEEGLSAPLLHRLKFGQQKLDQVCSGLKALAALPDPIGKTTYAMEITKDLCLYRVVCPIGVIGVIFESRPDALVQIASLCIKSGNAVLLKGGREALRTNQSLTALIRQALTESRLPDDCAQLLETREDVAAMLKEDELIDLIIPRGSNAFVRYIMDNSRIPVLGHADGVCHVYIDQSADPEMAVRIAVDSKTQNVSVCNAAETLLVHKEAAPAVLPLIASGLREKGVEIRGDKETAAYIDCVPASEDDWTKEYLDCIISVRIVSSLREAIDHINHFGSHHTDCIVTSDAESAAEFMNKVDSSGVYWNASTRFADGFVYGFGAEVGIATGKIHARGPMGLEGLTTYKYKLIGSGHTMTEMKTGERQYTHRPLPLSEGCPI